MSLVTFNRIGPKKAPALDVRDLAAALEAEPEVWFAVRTVSGGDRDGITAVMAALKDELGKDVKLWEPHGRGFYCVTLAATDKPYENEHA